MRLRKNILVLFFLCITTFVFGETKILWKDLVPMEHYSAEEVNKLLKDNGALLEYSTYEILSLRVSIFYRTADASKYTVSKINKNSKRVLVCIEPLYRDMGGFTEFFCIDTTSKNVGDAVFFDERNIGLYGQNEKGEHYIIYGSFTSSKMNAVNIGNLVAKEGGFYIGSFYFWDPNSKHIFSVGSLSGGDSKLKEFEDYTFENPMFFRITNDSKSMDLYISEVDENRKIKTGEYWKVGFLGLEKQLDLLKY